MTDEMNVQNHAHMDQRNWQPGDTEDEEDKMIHSLRELPEDMREHVQKVLARKTLRTLKRLKTLMRIYGAKIVAEAIFPHVSAYAVLELALYLEVVAGFMAEQMQCKCAECGCEVGFKITRHIELDEDTGEAQVTGTRELQRVRRDVLYCSAKCRQKAHRKRKRVTASVSDTTAEPSRVTDVPSQKAA